MNSDDAKQILLLYRPGTADADDPQIAEALALAETDLGLRDWLAEHCARQDALRAKFREITPPPGLKEQIISEAAAERRATPWRRPVLLAAMAAAVVAVIGLSFLWFRPAPGDTFATYRNRMVSVALRGYDMDKATGSLEEIRAYLTAQQAPSDYMLPEGLRQVAATGCAIQKWQGAKVAMVCFRTGKPLGPGEQSDLWLFVIDRGALKNAPPPGGPQFARVNRLMTATWTQGDKVYLLGTFGDEQSLRAYL